MGQRLTNVQINQALKMYDAGIPVVRIAERFGVERKTIDIIIEPTRRYGEKWYAWFAPAWNEARYLASGGKYGKIQEGGHEAR